VLSDYNIQDRSILHLIIKSSDSDGCDLGIKFVDISDEIGLKRVEFEENDEPSWRHATLSLCSEGKCLNHFCKTDAHRVIIPIGYKKFDLVSDSNESSTKCPMFR